ncbi:MAG: glycosyltransferase family 2 protein [Actinomycetota bacterium]|nr:glycosyltransferase family 2 protein [Actinomycetota bacterium]
MTDAPLISIITPCLNRAELVGSAIESVLRQGYPKIEHIIIDGGSTDGTLDVLRCYPQLSVSSEPDGGVYDGFNKGIDRAKGEIIGILNSDDLYEPDVFDKAVKQFTDNPEIDAVLGMADLFEESVPGARTVVARYDFFKDENFLSQPGTLSSPAINAHFFRRRVFSRFGQFDLRYRLAADIDFFLRLIAGGIRHTSLGQVTYHYRLHPGSLTLSGTDYIMRKEAAAEQLTLAERFLGDQNLSLEVMNACRKWHTKISMDFAGHSLRRKHPVEAVAIMLRGARHDLLWPLRFIGHTFSYVTDKETDGR